jgi:hypothetical protein
VALGERLGGRRVESLAMLAWVSPAGFASVLERASSRGAAGTVLVLMNGESLRLPEATFAATGYEKMVLEGAPAPRFGPLRQAVSDVRGGLFHDVIRRAVAFPLPGTYGRAYGGPDELAEALAASHGGVVDPNRYKPQAGEYLFEVSDPVSRRLLVLRDAIRHCGAGRTRLGLTPIPEGRVGPRTVESRRGVLERLRRQLGLPVEAIVETPVALPDSMFATATHLAAPGRAKFTAAVAAGLGSPR